MPKKVFTLSNGEICGEVDSLRLVVMGDGEHSSQRVSDIWKFFPHKKSGDFFVTSASMQSEMKGSVHLSQAHFGFSKPFREVVPRNWVGPLPGSRLYHALKIRDLADGESQPIFSVSFPGFAQMSNPLDLPPGKDYIYVPTVASEFEISFRLTVVQGDWQRFITEAPNHRYVGLLTGENGRHALISVAVLKYDDLEEAVANINRNLHLIDVSSTESLGDLSVHFWMTRGDDEPIKVIELHGLQAS